MVKIGNVWDRTVDVLRGRAGILAMIALIAFIVPPVIGAALRSIVPLGGGAQALALLVSLVTVALLIFGVLAVSAVASDPAVDLPAALGLAGRRLGAALGVLIVLVLAAALFFLPAGAALALSGATVNAAGGVDVRGAASGPLMLSLALVLIASIAGLWLSARLVPLFAIVVNERRGLRALRRSFGLTRGSALKLIGVLILYGILVIVAMMAATTVIGTVARLLLGSEADASVAFVVAIASALVSALTTVVQSVFYAQFYVAARAREEAAAGFA